MLNIKKIKPMFDSIVTTANKWGAEELQEELIATNQSGTLKEFQTVVAVGDTVKGVKVGDLVCINPDNYAVRKFQQNSMKADMMENDVVRYNFNVVELDHIPHLVLTVRDIRYIIEEAEEETHSSIINSSPLILT